MSKLLRNLLPLERPRAKLFFRAKGAHALSLRVTSLLSVGSGAPCSCEMAADDDLEVLDDWLDDTVPQEPWQPEFPAAPRLPPGLEPSAALSGGSRLRSEELPLEPPRLETPPPRWVCFRCEGELFGQDREGWYCLSCLSRDFYNSKHAKPSSGTSRHVGVCSACGPCT